MVICRFYRHGFPHSEICGSKDACSLPQLFAACHVLHRLEVPRHPPCALSSLTIKFTHEQQAICDFQLPIDNWKAPRLFRSKLTDACTVKLALCVSISCYSIIKELRLLSTKRRNLNAHSNLS